MNDFFKKKKKEKKQKKEQGLTVTNDKAVKGQN